MRFQIKSNNVIALIIAALLIVTGIVLGVINQHSKTAAPTTSESSAGET